MSAHLRVCAEFIFAVPWCFVPTFLEFKLWTFCGFLLSFLCALWSSIVFLCFFSVSKIKYTGVFFVLQLLALCNVECGILNVCISASLSIQANFVPNAAALLFLLPGRSLPLCLVLSNMAYKLCKFAESRIQDVALLHIWAQYFCAYTCRWDCRKAFSLYPVSALLRIFISILLPFQRLPYVAFRTAYCIHTPGLDPF